MKHCLSLNKIVYTPARLRAVSCDPPTQLLHRPVFIDSGAQDNPHIEGQSITYACPPRFVLTGPNTSLCTGNGEWEPDPGNVNCVGDCINPIGHAVQ